jgi:hypothetical protein
MDMMKKIVDQIIGEEYGGCHPDKDEVCILKAMVSDGQEGYGARILYVWVVGKWRPLGRTGYKGLPSNKVVTEAIQRIRLNTGSKLDAQGNLVGGTFGRKEIMLQFIKFGVSADTLRS